VLVEFPQKFCLSRICRGCMRKNECQAGVESTWSDSKIVHICDNIGTDCEKYQLKLSLGAGITLTLKCIANVMSGYNIDGGVPVLACIRINAGYRISNGPSYSNHIQRLRIRR
jgi:hypothetical protein